MEIQTQCKPSIYDAPSYDLDSINKIWPYSSTQCDVKGHFSNNQSLPFPVKFEWMKYRRSLLAQVPQV